jgi:TM2 domain-containing membrane protein YozV
MKQGASGINIKLYLGFKVIFLFMILIIFWLSIRQTIDYVNGQTSVHFVFTRTRFPSLSMHFCPVAIYYTTLCVISVGCLMTGIP